MVTTVVANPGRTLVIPADIGSLFATRLAFPNKSQMSSLDFSLDISELLAADEAYCAQAVVQVLGPEDQDYPMVVVRQPTAGSVITAVIGGGDLYVAYALRFTFVTAATGMAPKTYALDVWLTVANLASYSGQFGGYMSNTGYPTGAGPAGPPGAGVTTAAADSGLVITGATIGFNGLLLPTDPTGLPAGAPWNNNGVLSFAPSE